MLNLLLLGEAKGNVVMDWVNASNDELLRNLSCMRAAAVRIITREKSEINGNQGVKVHMSVVAYREQRTG